MDINIDLTLHISEVNMILETLGELPSKSGAYLLLMKIKEQGEKQLPPPPAAEPVEEAPLG